MGQLRLQDNHQVTDESGNPVPMARLHVYFSGTDTLAPLYGDYHLTRMRENPVQADAAGHLPDSFLIDGTYRVVCETKSGELVFEQEYHVESAPEAASNRTRTFGSSEALIADEALGYDQGAAQVVAPGDGILTLDRGFVYVVAGVNAADHQLVTAGGVKLYVSRTPDGAYHSAMWGVQPGIDESAKLTAALASASGTKLVINKVNGQIICDRLIPDAHTEIVLEAGVEIAVIPGGSRGIEIRQDNVRVSGYGARITMDGSQNSHGVFISDGARNCVIKGLEVVGAGSSGDDCFYVGGNPAGGDVPRNISIIDCVANGNSVARNCMSIVAVDGLLVDNFEAFNAGSSPGLGIDIEANQYMPDGSSAIRSVTIRRARCHDNPNNAGIAVIFGSDVTLEDCECWNNGAHGIAVDAGGANFDDGVARKGDVLGINSFDTLTGWIEVTDGLPGNLLSDDLGISEGMFVNRNTVAGASWPPEYTQSRYQIVEIDASQSKLRLGLSKDAGEITSLSNTGTGARSFQPFQSDLRLLVCGRPGNNDRIRMIRAKCWGNGQEGIEISKARDVVVTGCSIYSHNTGLNVNFTNNVVVTENLVQQEPAGTGGRGVMVTASGFVSDRNVIRGFSLEGFRVDGASGAHCGRDQITNCGSVGNIAYRVYNCKTGFFAPVIKADPNRNPNVGLQFEASCAGCVADGAIAKGVGASNATSLTGGVATVWRDCVQKDGTFK